jgi:glycosyltransferase involved in cell wall biosynthesis
MLHIGKARPSKAFHLLAVISQTLIEIARFKPDVVYYTPGGADHWPMIRDCVTLLCVRPFSKHLVLHFHAGGVSEVWTRGIRFRLLRSLFRRAFFNADAAIMLSPNNPPDGVVLQARKIHYVTNGIRDERPSLENLRERRSLVQEPGILFVGVLLDSKGVVELARACSQLWDEGLHFRLDYVGQFSGTMGDHLKHIVGSHRSSLTLWGELRGNEKWERYAESSIFCLPSYFRSEGVPVTIIEAMMFELPVVGTRWRGIGELVVDGVTGSLVECHEVDALSRRLAALIEDPVLRQTQGRLGRERFEEHFSLDVHLQRMKEVFESVAADD